MSDAEQPTSEYAVKHEKQHNVLLVATRPPTGSLQAIPNCAEMNAMLVPQQAYLDRIRIAPYCELRKVRARTATDKSSFAIYGSDKDRIFAPREPSTAPELTPSPPPASPLEASQGGDETPQPPVTKYLTRLSVGQYDAVNTVLCDFVREHLLAFARPSGASFITAAGAHGEFSDVLDKVTVTTAHGLVAARILGDLDPMNPLGNFMESARHVCCPASLPIYITDRSLLSDDTVQRLLVRLHSIVVHEDEIDFDHIWSTTASPPPPPEEEGGNNGTREDNASGRPSHKLERTDDDVRVPVAASGTPPPDPSTMPPPVDAVAPTAAPRTRYMNAVDLSHSLRSEDLENDVTVEIDLTPFESKVQERQRRSEIGVSHSEMPVNLVRDSARQRGTIAAAPPAAAALAKEGRGSGELVVKGTPVHKPSAPPSRGEPQKRDGANPTTGNAPTAAVATAGPNTNASAPPRVLQHEYSRESIFNYRQVVAADNEIHYREFQLLLEQPLSMPLVELLSMFVSEMQQQEHVFYDNQPVLKLRTRWATRLAAIPLLASSERKTRILNEGMEKYITSKLYFQMYNVRPDEQRDNTVMQDKWQEMVAMPAASLDALAEVEAHHTWGQAMFELDGMNFFKSPREKLRCCMRACELLSLSLGDVLEKRRRDRDAAKAKASGGAANTTNTNNQNSRRNAPLAIGADEFIPCFVLLVLRAQPYNYCQNVSFIELFRSPDLMTPEESYCLATVLTANEFWLRCDRNGQIPSSSAQHMSATPNSRSSSSKSAPAGAKEDRVGAAAIKSVPPPLREDDLLPSIKNSRTAAVRGSVVEVRAGTNGNVASAAASSSPSPGQAAAGPTVLDTLFEWVNNVTHPAQATSAPPAGATSPKMHPQPGSAGDVPILADNTGAPVSNNFLDRWRRSGTNTNNNNNCGGGGSGGVFSPSSAPVQTGLLKADAGSPPMEPVRGSVGDSPLARGAVASQTSAVKVRQLLVAQNKPFEALSVSELQLVVEEMRKRLLQESS